MEYSNIEKVTAKPEAAPLMQTYRSIGYSLETALADIVDNSISAGAKNIWIGCDWQGDQTTISIKDDGCGMNNEEAVSAMTLGKISPLHHRNENDLGRFGLGLKTASFSQCKKLSIFTKKEDFHDLYWCWDLDYVTQSNSWELIRWMPEKYISALDSMDHGTVVIWSDLDQLIPIGTTKKDEKAQKKFYESMSKAEAHVAMTFHRFIENGLNIYWANHKVEAWNPFFTSENKVQPQPAEIFYIRDQEVVMKGYVLPKKNDFSSEEAFLKAEGYKGFAHQQGFYIYRGDRLLVAGNWMGLLKPKDSTKLARISVDLPNTVDSEWLINIMKSTATPPSIVRDKMKSYGLSITKLAENVYKTRKKRTNNRQNTYQQYQPLWSECTENGEWSFVINQNNILVKNIKEMAVTNPSKAFDTFINLIESTLPVQKIYIHEADDSEIQKDVYNSIDMGQIKTLMNAVYENLLGNGYSPEQAKNVLEVTEPFDSYIPLINEL